LVVAAGVAAGEPKLLVEPKLPVDGMLGAANPLGDELNPLVVPPNELPVGNADTDASAANAS
jgi:hypothetical protein